MTLPRRRTLIFVLVPLILLALAILLFSGPKHPTLVPARPIAASKPAIDKPQADLILDLFEPDSTSLAAQHSDATISNQIEHAMVVSFLLARCDLISHEEYSDSYNAFIRYAVATKLAPDANAAATRVKAIAKSASASYSLVYSRVPCSDPSLPPLVEQLENWRRKIE